MMILILAVFGIIFFVLDIILIATFIYWRRKNNEKHDKVEEAKQLLEFDPRQLAKESIWSSKPRIHITNEHDDFVIPCQTMTIQGNERKLYKKKSLPEIRKPDPGYLDVSKYEFSSFKRQTQSGKPRLSFELFYYLRTSELQVTIKKGKQLFNIKDEQFCISIMLSNSCLVQHSSRVEGPNPAFNEEFRFPISSEAISADPPVRLKFNIWTVDRYSKKSAFGFVDVLVEDVIAEHGLMPHPGKAITWMNVTRCETLSDSTSDNLPTEISIHLTYLSAARRIVVVINEVKNLQINAMDKKIFAKITLTYRDSEKKSFFSNVARAKKDIKFNEEFVFHLSEFPNLGIDGIAISIELHANQNKMISKPRMIGHTTIGNSGKSERTGREHWAKMLTSATSISKWHCLQESSLARRIMRL